MRMRDDEIIKVLEERICRLEKLVEKLLNKESTTVYGESESPILASFDFSDEKCRKDSGWKIYNAENLDSDNALSFKAIQVERTLGIFYDPMMIYENLNLPCDKIKYVRVKLKSNVDASQKCMLRVYFTTEKNEEFSQARAVHSFYPAGRSTDVYVETKNRYWTGNLTGIRIDPVEGLSGSIEIDLIELLDENKNTVFKTDFSTVTDIDKTGWTFININDISCNSQLQFNVGALEKKRVYTDPFMKIDNLNIDAGVAKFIHIKMCVDIESKGREDAYMQILFKTKSSDFWTQDKSMRYSYTTGKEIDAYIEVKQLFWKGTLISLRIDPFENYEGKAEIKLVELLREVPKIVAVDMLESRMRNLEDRFNRIYN